jgi:hypothetical protein
MMVLAGVAPGAGAESGGGVSVGVSVSVPLGASRGMQWGLWEPAWQKSDGTLDFSQVTGKEKELGHRADLVHWYASWSEDWGYDGPIAQQVLSSGRTPLITWEAHRRSLRQIAAGDYDAYIDSWARGLAKLAPGVIDLRVFHEFNDPYQGDGSGYTWGVNGGTSNSPRDLVAAWRHVHDRFVAAGARNVRWVWCPDGANASVDVLRAAYPGDEYVDWAGWDQYGYDVDHVYDVLGQVTSKPLMVPEYGETKAPPISTLSGKLDGDQYPRVQAMVWFDDKSWRLDDLPDARGAVQKMLAGSAFEPPPPSPSPAPPGSPSPSPSPSSSP